MKRVFAILLFSCCCLNAKADHITGGEMFYTYAGYTGNYHTYNVTLKLFMRCNSGRQFPDPAVISVFDKATGIRVNDITINISLRTIIQITTFDPCISDPPPVCYEVAYYYFLVSVPASTAGYVLSSQVNYRIRGISNLDGSQVGATYTCDIPGFVSPPDAQVNNSATFVGSDLVVVCAGNYFSYSFAATDKDHDPIRYSFCAAYASTNGGTNGTPAGAPPYHSVPYNSNFSEISPLGGKVSINPSTGLITGIAPPAGVYVVTVCAEEIRQGKVIGVQRKDVQINVADCSIASALLEEDYMLCGNTRSISVSNKSTSPLIVSQDWEIFDAAGNTIFTSSASPLSYTFATNGTYRIKLTINKGQKCSDSTSALVYVYPGLVPDFQTTGICITKPTIFTDRTTLLSGSVNSWRWDYGEPTVLDDTSITRNNIYTYPVMGQKDIRLIVTTTDGCRDTVFKSTFIIDKPPIALKFRDTLICVNDNVQLEASGTGNFTWSPLVNMMNANSATPTVAPSVTTTYYVNLETDGCINKDSVKIRVVDHVSLGLMGDTLICRGDTIQLRIVSDGLQYSWQPALQALNPAVQNPFVSTSASTPYQVTSTIGSCSATGTINVNTVPYPFVRAGTDTLICYNTSAQLHGSTDGTRFAWSPASTLQNAGGLTPVAFPANPTTNYVLTAYEETRGCPKPSRDTVMVTMLPKIRPFAGRDTTVVINQPLQLNATGGDRYIWSPAFALSTATIPNPVALFAEPSDGLRFKVDVFNIAGCSDSDFINIKVFATLPTVFVPTAFTPNNDGKNDVLRPIAVGMKKIEYFNIYSRWGQLVFSTSIDSHGWDGRIGGQSQGSNTYVWIVKAVDFTGKAYFQKGTVTLIR